MDPPSEPLLPRLESYSCTEDPKLAPVQEARRAEAPLFFVSQASCVRRWQDGTAVGSPTHLERQFEWGKQDSGGLPVLVSRAKVWVS